jgi:hypothetical protein
MLNLIDYPRLKLIEAMKMIEMMIMKVIVIVMIKIMMRIIKIKIKNVMKRDNKYECEYNDNNEDEGKYIRDNDEDKNSVYWC